MYPDSLKNLIESFKFLPSVGEKTAERFAFSIFDLDDDQIQLFKDSLDDVRNKVHPCSICNVLTENDICSICSDEFRSSNILCVVEDVKSVFLFEKIGMFKGKYHVLNGLISPLDGIGPDDIDLEGLIGRLDSGDVKEIILALKPSVEGEATMQYIKKILEHKDIKVSKIATGVPIGTDMEYIDSLTLELAIDERKNMN